MPFTLSHAAAALPIQRVLRGRTVLSLLVIGCFLPDVPYFLPEPLADINAHRPLGMLLFGVPCGWAIYIVWRYVLLAPLAALLPRAYAHLVLASAATPAPLRAGTLSLLLGAVSHVAWDAFTHRRGLVVHVWPALAQPLVHVAGHGLPSYFFFQHGSSVAGFLCLALFVRRRQRDAATREIAAPTMAPFTRREKFAAIALMALAALAIVLWRFNGAGALDVNAYNVVCESVSAACLAALAYALAWQALHARVRRGR